MKFKVGDKVIMRNGLMGEVLQSYTRNEMPLLSCDENENNFYRLCIDGYSDNYYAAESGLTLIKEE